MPDSPAWREITAPSNWNGGINTPFPIKGWKFEDGVLSTTSRPWRSVYSKEQFREFELEFEWNLEAGGNSGVKYLCSEGMIDPDWQAGVENAPYALGGMYLSALLIPALAWRLLRKAWLRWALTAFSLVVLVAALSSTYLYYQARSRVALTPPGFEYQLIDNRNYRLPLKPDQWTAGLYDLIAPLPGPEPAMNEWHSARIVVRGGKVEHWLDGRLTARFELGSSALRQAVAQSKFRRVPGFAEPRTGYLMLQTHDGRVAFRNVRVRSF